MVKSVVGDDQNADPLAAGFIGQNGIILQRPAVDPGSGSNGKGWISGVCGGSIGVLAIWAILMLPFLL